MTAPGAALRERFKKVLIQRMCTFLNWTDADFDAVIDLIRDAACAEQRETDAKIARDFIEKGAYANTCLDIAAAIRAEGETR